MENRRLLLLLVAILFAFPAFLFSQQTVLYNHGDIYIMTGENIYINGGFQNSGNAQIVNTGTIHVSGDWINNASNHVFPSATGTVRLYGGNQNIGGTNATDFANLTLEGTGVKALNINTSVANILALNDREIATQSNTLSILSTAANAITRTSGFVSTGINGSLIRNTNGAGTWLFPMGGSSPALGYRPVEINPFGGGTGAFDVTLANENPTISGYNISLFQSPICIVNHKYYHKVKRSAGSGNVNLNYYFDDTADGAFTLPVEWDGSLWEVIGGSVLIPGTSPVLSYFSLANFALQNPSIIAMADSAPANGTPIIYESNNILYAGQGTSFQWYLNGTLIPLATQNSYTPTTQGTYSVFVTIAGNCSFMSADYFFYFVGLEDVSNSPEIRVYPNPFSSHINLNINSFVQGEVFYKIFNAAGQLVKNGSVTQESGNREHVIHTDNLIPGVYFLNISNKNLHFTEKLIMFGRLER